jgi:diadenosine tetraphosphate (Ap4A) HIT family hydrolase
LEVPHVHVHLVPIWDVHDLDFANAERDPGEEALAAAADKVRKAIAALR